MYSSVDIGVYHIFESYTPISTEEYNAKIAILKEDEADYLDKKYDFINKSLGLKMQVRFTDVKAIETIILKNKNYNELDKLAQIVNKSYPKSMQGDYLMALMYEKKGDNERAARYYQLAFLKNEIGDLTKDLMIDKVAAMKKLMPKKGSKSAPVAVEETPIVEEVKTEIIKEEPKTK